MGTMGCILSIFNEDNALILGMLSDFASIIGIIVAIITIRIAYKQYSLSKDAKLKIQIKNIRITRTNRKPEEFLVLYFINKGQVEIYINEIAIRFKKVDYRIENFLKSENNHYDELEFPIRVINSQGVAVRFEYDTLQYFVRSTDELTGMKGRKYLKFIITDKQGNVYKKRIRYT